MNFIDILKQRLLGMQTATPAHGRHANLAGLRRGAPLKPGDCPHYYTRWVDRTVDAKAPKYVPVITHGHSDSEECPAPYLEKAAGYGNSLYPERVRTGQV